MRRTTRSAVPWRRLALLAALALLLAVLSLRAFTALVYPQRYREAVERYSLENELPVSLVYGVIRTESGFRPDAVSSVGARGLMQITEETFEWARWRMGDETAVYDDLFDAETNIRYGTFILRLLLEEFGDVSTALAAYHAGWGSVKGWLAESEYSANGVTLDSIPFRNTARYVPKVRNAASMYQKLYGGIMPAD